MKKFLLLFGLCFPLILFSQEVSQQDSILKVAQDFFKIKRLQKVPLIDSLASDSSGIPDNILEMGRENIGKSFPNFRAISLKGESYSSEALEGKVTFVNFWFERCQPCIAEFEALNDLYKKYKNYKEFQFLSFTWEKRENALRVVKKYGLEYPVIPIPPDSCRKLINNSYAGYPTNIIINRTGKIQFFITGGPNHPDEAKKIEQYIYIPKLEALLNPKEARQ